MTVSLRASNELSAPDEPLGFLSDAGLSDVEGAMTRLAVGSRLSRSGQMVQEHLSTGGKRVRARLALAATEALGGARARAVAWGAACELLHNATLVHDDVQDGDTMRRDQPTTWVRHGIPQAINAGDLLLMLPFLALAELPADGETRWQLSHALARAAEATVRGQSLEMDLLASRRLGWEDWLRAAEGKTGALLGVPVEGAAMLVGLDARTASRFGQAFAQIGLLYQLQDDLLDTTDRKGRGFRGSDLAEGKVSALVVEHLARAPSDTAALIELLSLPRDGTPRAEIDRWLKRFEESGALAGVRARAARCAASIAQAPMLRAVPDLHRVAMELVSLMDHSIDLTVERVEAAPHPHPVPRSSLA